MNQLTHEAFCNRARMGSVRLYVHRLASMCVHVLVIVLGLYTRYPRFFAQFTNWTNMVSAFYQLLALVEHTWYLRMSAPARTRQSRFPSFLYLLLSFVGPIHVIVTTTYWPFCWSHAQKNTWQDIVYIVSAHGVTLALLYVEKSVLGSCAGQPVRGLTVFNFQLLYIVTYGIFALELYRHTGYLVYSFMKGLPLYCYVAFVPLMAAGNFLFRIGARLFE